MIIQTYNKQDHRERSLKLACEDKCKGFGIPNFCIMLTQVVLFTILF